MRRRKQLSRRLASCVCLVLASLQRTRPVAGFRALKPNQICKLPVGEHESIFEKTRWQLFSSSAENESLGSRPEDASKQVIDAQQKQINQLMDMLASKAATVYDPSSRSQSQMSSVSVPPLKVMLFVDGTWLYYALHTRNPDTCPIQQRFGKGWQFRYSVDWNNLPRLVCQALQEQDRGRGWVPQSGTGDQDSVGRPIEVVRVSVFTSYRADTPKTSLRYQMFQDMVKAKFDVLMLETVGHNEKCVDIQLAVDMLHYATVPDAYDVALLLTGDKDFMPAMVRCRQKGRRVGMVSMRGSCTRAFFETPNIKDYDIIWMDDHLDKFIRPKAEKPHLQGNRPKPRIALSSLVKIISDFVTASGVSKVSSRDIGRYIKSLRIGDRCLLDEVKEIYGGLYQVLILAEIFTVEVPSGTKNFLVGLKEKPDEERSEAIPETQLTMEEKSFFEIYSVSRLQNRKKYYEYTLQNMPDDEEESTTDPPDYNQYTVLQLKEFCRDKGLRVSGKKAELVERIMLHDQETNKGKTNIEGNANLKDKAPGVFIEDRTTNYLEGLLLEYLHAKGGTASSRDVGRYLTANKASAEMHAKDPSIRSALTELKFVHGTLKQFVMHSELFLREEMEDGDHYEFLIRSRARA